MNITEQLVKTLRARGKKAFLVSPQVLLNWEQGKNSPRLKNVDHLLKENDIEVLLFDGNLEDLISFAKKVSEKRGMKLVLTFEV